MIRRAFSLIELLLSVFILAIGIISVSALFPAGIAQQQQTTDDQLGPVAAEQALGLLRSRVRPEDFGSFEEFGIGNVLLDSTGGSGSYAYRPVPGDWSWIRPGVIRQAQPDVVLPNEEQPGSIDLFSRIAQRTPGPAQEFCEFPSGLPEAPSAGQVQLFGAPYNSARWPVAPLIVVSQRERWWPSVPSGEVPTEAPRYCWECMFRRSGGRIQVAIFVFRVVGAGGTVRKWYASSSSQSSSYVDAAIAGGSTSMTLPPVPYRRVLASPGGSAQEATGGDASLPQVTVGWTQPPGSATSFPRLDMSRPGPFTTGLVAQGTAGTPGDAGQGLLPSDIPAGVLPPIQHQWQYPGQWLVDNNGNVHRVAVGRRISADPPQVRLSAPIPRVPPARAHDCEAPALVAPGVRTFHYVPAIIDSNGTQLVPVYVTVRDL